MRPNEFGGRTVIDTEASVLGDVCDIEFDTSSWKVTHICVSLSDKAVDELGYQKPRFIGRVLINIPVKLIQAVGDVVSLNKSIKEIKTVAELYR